jgi:hypothetical protein
MMTSPGRREAEFRPSESGLLRRGEKAPNHRIRQRNLQESIFSQALMLASSEESDPKVQQIAVAHDPSISKQVAGAPGDA